MQVKGKQIEVYERAGADPEAMLDFLKQDARMGLRLRLDPEMHDRAREVLDRGVQFMSFLRFVLHDPDRRLFGVQRRRYSGRGDEWITLSLTGTIEQLVPQIIPKLDTDAFFEIF